MKRLFFAALAAFAVVCPAHADSHHLDRSEDPVWKRRVLLASRNSSGTYSLPNSPFISGTTISSTVMNGNFSDAATELTNSLDRNGRGGMLASLRGVDGTNAAPAYSYTSEPGSGWYRIGANDFGFAVNAVKVLELTGSAVLPALALRSIDGLVSAPGLSFASETGTGFYRIGASDIGFAVGGVKKQEWTAIANTIYAPLTVSPGASGILGSFLDSSLAAGQSVFLYLGLDAATSNATSNISFNKNATPANSTLCMQLQGQSNTLCVDGNGATKTAGPLQANSLTIGTSGTAISASIRGTVSATPGSIPAQSCAQIASITATGAASGSECAWGGPTSTDNFSFYCHAVADGCVIRACNPTAGALTPTSGSYVCRVFNP